MRARVARSMAGARRTSHDRWRSCVALQVRVASHRMASQTSSDAESTRWMSSMQSSVGGSEASAIRAMSSDLSSDDVSSYRTWVSTLEYPETPLSRLKALQSTRSVPPISLLACDYDSYARHNGACDAVTLSPYTLAVRRVL